MAFLRIWICHMNSSNIFAEPFSPILSHSETSVDLRPLTKSRTTSPDGSTRTELGVILVKLGSDADLARQTPFIVSPTHSIEAVADRVGELEATLQKWWRRRR
jgi:hypothetical protein